MSMPSTAVQALKFTASHKARWLPLACGGCRRVWRSPSSPRSWIVFTACRWRIWLPMRHARAIAWHKAKAFHSMLSRDECVKSTAALLSRCRANIQPTTCMFRAPRVRIYSTPNNCNARRDQNRRTQAGSCGSYGKPTFMPFDRPVATAICLQHATSYFCILLVRCNVLWTLHVVSCSG